MIQEETIEMRYMFGSDIHGSAYWCEKLVKAYKESKAEKLVLLGDILYHGPRNDLPYGYSPKKVVELLAPLRDDILCVRGNCDAEVDQMVLPFPCMADYAVLALDGKVFYVTHGHIYNTLEDGKNLPPMNDGEILIHGHTHVPVAEHVSFPKKTIAFLNPGSVSLPKEESAHSYGLYEDRIFKILDFDGNVVKSIEL